MTRRDIDNAVEGLYPDERLASICRDAATATVAAGPVGLAMQTINDQGFDTNE